MLSCKHSKFTLSQGVTYLNCAYMSPLLKKVEKAGIRGIRQKRMPSQVTPEMFFTETDLLRKEYAKLISANDPSRVVIIPSVSYGMATVAKNLTLRPGDEILIAAEQFPSNVYPWMRKCEETGASLRTIAPPDELTGRGSAWNQRILEAITTRTRLVALGHVHWADGTKFNLEAIRKRTHDVGALLVIDGTQSVGALPFDVNVIKPDALICAGYKWLLGPYSIGLAHYGDYFADGKPVEDNWINRLNSDKFSELVNYQPEFQPGALRYEVGEHSNFILVPMLLRALEQLNRWGISQIQEYCQHITSSTVDAVRERGFWVEDESFRGSHMFGLRVPEGYDVEKLKQKLLEKKIFVSYRGNAIRIAPNVYNNETDLQRFAAVLLKL